jgi:hypothetical protein
VTKEASSRPLPPNWASDSLSEYLHEAFGNLLATFVKKKPQYEILVAIDRCFSGVTDSFPEAQESLAPLFLTRSHSAYRTECQLAMSGQSTESFCIGRSCLEFALYGLHISDNPDLEETWLQRHNNEESFYKVGKEFSNKSVLKTLARIDHDLHATVEQLYQRTIDYGGHPNERSVTSNMSMSMVDEHIMVRQFYLQGESLALEHALKTAAQIGLAALYIFRHVFHEQFEKSNVISMMNQLRESL